MKVLSESELEEMRLIAIDASRCHATLQRLRERSCQTVGVQNDYSELSQIIQELVDVEGVDHYDVGTRYEQARIKCHVGAARLPA